MKYLLPFYVVCVGIVIATDPKDVCDSCVLKEKCQVYGNMSKTDQKAWEEKFPCTSPEESNFGSPPGFSVAAKGDYVCCSNKIWGITNDTNNKNTSEKLTQNRYPYFNDDNDGYGNYNRPNYNNRPGYGNYRPNNRWPSNFNRPNNNWGGQDRPYWNSRNPNGRNNNNDGRNFNNGNGNDGIGSDENGRNSNDRPGNNFNGRNPNERPGNNFNGRNPNDRPGNNFNGRNPNDRPGNNFNGRNPNDRPGNGGAGNNNNGNTQAPYMTDGPGFLGPTTFGYQGGINNNNPQTTPPRNGNGQGNSFGNSGQCDRVTSLLPDPQSGCCGREASDDDRITEPNAPTDIGYPPTNINNPPNNIDNPINGREIPNLLDYAPGGRGNAPIDSGFAPGTTNNIPRQINNGFSPIDNDFPPRDFNNTPRDSDNAPVDNGFAPAVNNNYPPRNFGRRPDNYDNLPPNSGKIPISFGYPPNRGPSNNDNGSGSNSDENSGPRDDDNDDSPLWMSKDKTEVPKNIVPLNGTADVEVEKRISGGIETDLYQFPWTALLIAVFDYGNKQSAFNCGGSLISSKFILTAGHCVYDKGAVIKSVEVYLAEYDRRTFPRDCKMTSQGRKCIDNVIMYAENVFRHPQYDDDGLLNDIALVKLRGNAPYTDYIRPICLPTINIDDPQYSNLRLTVAGWGRNGKYKTDIKQSTVVNLVPQNECKKFYPTLSTRHLCAAGYKGEDTCKGDSGGPLMTLYRGKYYVVGVVSGKRSDSPCGTSVPSLYTNVYHYLDWIRSNIRN